MSHVSFILHLALSQLLLWTSLSFSGCSKDPDSKITDGGTRDLVYTEEREPCSDYNPLRNLYFGDLHSHVDISYDAWIWDARLGPEDAYRFARGESLKLPPFDENGEGTRPIRLDRPLDFAAVTDHAEFFAEVEACVTPGSEVYNTFPCNVFRSGSDLAFILFGFPLSTKDPKRLQAICGPGGIDCPGLADEVWNRIREAAEDAYDRSSDCSFTSFAGYEYTGSTRGSTLHRNVLFRNASVPEQPVSYFEQPNLHALRIELKRTCLDGLENCDVITIPHNSNMSNGNMFFVDLDAKEDREEIKEEMALRARMEPMVEIFQHKGGSECMNGLSGVPGEPDDLCNFENLHPSPFKDCGDGTGTLGGSGRGCISRYDFVRYVLLKGLKLEESIGLNPYRLGFSAATDTHNMTPGSVAEDMYLGHLGNLEDTPEERLGTFGVTPTGIRTNPGGLTGVWAVENSRDALFNAFQRRETFATSGPRIEVRFFGGWDYPMKMCDTSDPVSTGYRQGVPMGGDLPPPPDKISIPRFFVSALRETFPQVKSGTLLQRIQIVKGWITRDLQLMQKVFDVAGDPENGAGVDLETCQTLGQGFSRLCTVWSDTEFDSARPAFYYARVIENPSCRWSTHECIRLAGEERPAGCSETDPPKTIQERAWTSPIWYGPTD